MPVAPTPTRSLVSRETEQLRAEAEDAERITQDANEQVAASLEHAQRITAKADDFDKLMRAQAQQHEADARLRSREILDRASVKAQKIIDTVTGHSQSRERRRSDARVIADR